MKKTAVRVVLLFVVTATLIWILHVLLATNFPSKIIHRVSIIGEGSRITTNFNSPVPRPREGRNSVFAATYYEQLTMAMNSLFTLAAVAKHWNATLPLPFTSDSYLFGLPAGSRQIKLSMVYDTARLDVLMKQYNLSPFTTFDKFLHSASRNVIVLELKFGRERDYQGRHIYIEQCSKSSTHLLSQLNQHTSNHSLQPFQISKCCHILTVHVTSLQEISSTCGIHHMSGGVTVLFNEWRGIDDTGWFRLYIKDFHTPCPNPWVPLSYSNSIIANSNALLTANQVLTKKFLGVHLRSEKVWYRTRDSTVFNQCFQMVLNLTEELSLNHSSIPILYFGDNHTEQLFGKQMSKHNITLVQCNMLDCERDGGFKAQVEQEMVSRAEVLVLVGGGSFQLQIYSRYRTHQNTGLVYRACDDTSSDSSRFPVITNWKGPKWLFKMRTNPFIDSQ